MTTNMQAPLKGKHIPEQVLQGRVSDCMNLVNGDLVEFDWGDKVVCGLFVKFENRPPIGRLCAMVEIEGRGVQPVQIIKVRKL